MKNTLLTLALATLVHAGSITLQIDATVNGCNDCNGTPANVTERPPYGSLRAIMRKMLLLMKFKSLSTLAIRNPYSQNEPIADSRFDYMR